jgi:elongation factor 1 alpha-like protein
MQTSWPAVSAVEMGYFADAPWGNIPEDRKGELVLEGPQLRGGLLGGSSSAPKSSKLAALAKRRKEKAQAAPATATGATTTTGEEKTSISLLSRLSHRQPPITAKPVPESSSSQPPSSQSPPETTSALLVPLQTAPKEQSIVDLVDLVDLDQPKKQEPVVPGATAIEQVVQQKLLGASPSSFAQSIFGERITLRHEISVADARFFFISGNKDAGKPNPFAGPSPDDVVVAAHSASKGL